jgi:predicted transposase/invertase (TIGR01784 family)
VIYHAQLKDQLNRVFYDKLTFIYLVQPRFNKTSEQLVTLQDKWLYVFKHLHELDTIPSALNEEIFHRTFAIAQLSQFSSEERKAYEDSIKYYQDLKNSVDTARTEGCLREGIELGKQAGRFEGMQEGMEKGTQLGIDREKREVAKRMLAKGLEASLVAELTGLNLKDVRCLVPLCDGLD